MNCPRCGKERVRSDEEVFAGLDTLYMPCPSCPPEPVLDKSAPFSNLSNRVGTGGERSL